MHVSSLLSIFSLASVALAGPVQVDKRQAQKLRISMLSSP
jgi:hypothetical protein